MPGSWKIGDAVQCPVCSVSHLPLDRDIKNGVFAANCQNCGHYFKFKVDSGLSSQITVRVNGKDYTVSSDKYSPTTTLNSFLRDSNISKGTKYMCTEGGCGTCMVQAKLYEPISDSNRAYSINSCLYPLFACDGWEITTIEGIPAEGDNAVPARLARYNGSQCGFCSPGQVMNMHSLLEFNKGQVSMQQVEDAYDCVICRCTGYRPILDAMKSFATDSPQYKKHKQPCFVDIEEIGKKICDKTGRKCTGSCHGNSQQMTKLILGDTQWFKPTTVQQVLDALEQNKTKRTKLVFGNTGFGIYKELAPENFESLIDLRGVQEMYTISFDTTGILGACLSITQVQDIFYRMQNEPGFGYFKQLYDRSRYLASHSVRNLGCWAGNLMLKHLHPEFPSDMYNMLTMANAQLMISDSKNLQATYNIKDFLSLDMTGKVIVAMILPSMASDVYIRSYKTAQRHQFAHAHVNAGIRMKVDKTNNFMVKEKPAIVYGGISASFTHAAQTEQYLTGKSLADPNVVKGALTTLASEVVPTGTDPTLTSPEYRKSLAIGFLYKFILDMLGDSIPAQFRSGAQNLQKPLSSGIQSYDTKPLEWPLTEPMAKIQSLAQTSGKAQYINDIPKKPGEVSVAFVVSTVGNARIQNIDASEVLKKPGVLKFLKASDIPGINNCFPPFSFFGTPDPTGEELFCSGKVEFCGQPLGIIITDGDQQSAISAASQVKVTYTDVQPPILTIEEAIKQQSFFPNQGYELKVGNAEAAIASAPRKITGKIGIGGQYHLHMETQVAICTPTEDGMNVDASTQWADFTQKAISMVLGCYESSINVKVKRLGGAYGGKITRNFPVSAATALAAHVMDRPARMAMDFHTNMETLGKRFNYMAEYEVGCSAEGKLLGVKITYYADCGCLPYTNVLAAIPTWADNAYYCANWHMIPVAVKTNKPMNAAARSPGSCPAIFITEAIMEHVAKVLGMDPAAFKTLNMYNQNQVTPIGEPLTYCNIKSLIAQLDQMASVTKRKQEIAVYNQANRWRKRAISVVPMKFGLDYTGVYYNVIMNIYSNDGSVSIAHGGVESGQGINTKVMQVCAYELGIPLEMIRVKAMNTLANANSVTTGGSVTSELNCQAVIKCCDELKQRMAPVKAKMTNPTWLQLVKKCSSQNVDLTARYYEVPKTKTPKAYNTYGVTATEVELDVLSGQYQILRTDMLYDCGESLNPEIDMGQAEGAFVMGLGYYLTEDLIFNPTTGALANNSTWEYKPPLHNDIPIDFRVHFLKNAPNPLGVLRSKASGEPPLCMSCSALFAVKHAVEAVRKDNGHDTYFALDGPATVEKIHKLCMLDPSQYVIST